LTLSLIDPTDRDASILNLRDIWQGGLSPGKWREVSQRGAKSLIRYEENRLARNMASLWIGKKQTDFAKCMEELIVIRNDHYHNRGPNVDAEFQKAVVDVAKLLNTVMESVAFLTEFPVRLVRDLNVVRGSRRVTLQTLRYVGDHPGMPNEQIGYPEALPKNDLYIQVRDDHWLPLYPFMTVQDCPRCRYRETYYVDRWDGSGKKAILKSFERGHTEENLDVGNSMATWQSA
jgi:hypothetical protein